MGLISLLAKSAMAGVLVAAPIGDTTVLLLSSISLEILLTLMLIRERRSRLEASLQGSGAPVEIPAAALCRTAPHMRARRPVSPRNFVMAGGS
ncbi:MAG: hypothetical protein JO162_02700 [Alphaproteobacteria bacterium]|nr:hypothetical protein [Alphaproteobacteria bacterium]MBV9585622.1 hypothetical protein [Alphaproteobacteria bacterium]MBV9965009.1 hypothetical protein [Alphaproteobacteria bacterium]